MHEKKREQNPVKKWTDGSITDWFASFFFPAAAEERCAPWRLEGHLPVKVDRQMVLEERGIF